MRRAPKRPSESFTPVKMRQRLLLVLAIAAGVTGCCFPASAADKKIILIAGKQSHGPGEHEFRAGCLLLHRCLDKVPGIVSEVYSNGWPGQDHAFDGADAILIYADGGAGHPALQNEHGKVLEALIKKGVGLGCAHFAVELPKDNGGPEFLEWLGGYYENWVFFKSHLTPPFPSLSA